MSEFDYALDCVNNGFDITTAYLSRKTRKEHVVKCRQTLAYLLVEIFKIGPTSCESWSLTNNIPSFDHSSVIHSVKVIQNLIDTNDSKYIDQVNKTIFMAGLREREPIENEYAECMPIGEFQHQRIDIPLDVLHNILNQRKQ